MRTMTWIVSIVTMWVFAFVTQLGLAVRSLVQLEEEKLANVVGGQDQIEEVYDDVKYLTYKLVTSETNKNECPPGSEPLTSTSECHLAAKELGLPKYYLMEGTSLRMYGIPKGSLPVGCLKLSLGTVTYSHELLTRVVHRVWFHEASSAKYNGAPHTKAAVICKEKVEIIEGKEEAEQAANYKKQIDALKKAMVVAKKTINDLTTMTMTIPDLEQQAEVAKKQAAEYKKQIDVFEKANNDKLNSQLQSIVNAEMGK